MSATPRPLSEAELRRAVDAAIQTMARGDFASARSALRTVLGSNPDDAVALEHYGVCAHLVGDLADAHEALVRAVGINPQSAIGWKFLASASNSLGDLQQLDVAARNALRLAPQDREVLNLYGLACINRFQIDEAARAFNALLEAFPDYTDAVINLELLSVRAMRAPEALIRSPGVAEARMRAIDRLRAQYRANQLDDSGLKALVMLLAGSARTFPEAVELARKFATREKLSTPLADQLAIVMTTVGDLAEVLRLRRIVARQDPGVPLVRSNLAFSQLLAGYEGWLENWNAMREEERHANLGIFAAEVPSWTGQPLGNGKLLVHQEQGIGDAILALRLIPMLAARGLRFDLWVVPTLAGLAGSLKGYESLVRSANRPDARSLGCQYASTLFGLISALGVGHQVVKDNPTVLVPSPVRLSAARARLGALPGRRIGLAYGGNPDRRDDWFRAVPPDALKPLAALEGISWVNLVVDNRPDKAEVIRMLGMDDPMTEARDFEDTAAIVSELDAVIAIDSSVAHLACSLGRPVWVLVPPMLDWRWQIGSDTKPWWPNATVLRSPAMGDWEGVIDDLAKQVQAWL